MWQGFPRGFSYADKHEKPSSCIVAQHAAVCGFTLPGLVWALLEESGKRSTVQLFCLGSFIHSPDYTGTRWSSFNHFKTLHNEIKLHNQHTLNMQNTRLASHQAEKVAAMMGLGGCAERDEERHDFQENGKSIRKGTQGKNKARRKYTCQTVVEGSQQLWMLCFSSEESWITVEDKRKGKKQCHAGTDSVSALAIFTCKPHTDSSYCFLQILFPLVS